MTNKMLIESDPHQTRIAILESDRLTETFVERAHNRGIVGNVYKGRVTRVLPGMQAAFVDIGLERDAFLYVRDVGELGEDDAADFDTLEEIEDSATSGPERSIDDLLKTGQELIVQVTKDALPNKGARLTTHVTLPSRYLVLLPTVRHLGISRRIENEEERERLRGILEELLPETGGLIVRTAGEDKGQEEFEADRRYLCGLWNRMRERAESVSAPALLHRDLDLALRVVRDLFGPEYSVLWVDGEDTYERILDFLDQVQPSLVHKVKLDRKEAALFDRFEIEDEIEAALSSKVWLKSGGYLVINPTEALVAIDVNTGRYVGRQSLEETVLKTNLEAAREVVRQIRLRDLSGIIVIDLIDMSEPRHREQVFEALESELRKDRAKNKVLNISEFGLVELTRKRSHKNLERLLTQPCPYCHGSGRIKAISTICFNVRRAVLKSATPGIRREVLLRVHPEVAEALQTDERAIFEEMERVLGSDIVLQSDDELHHERFDILEL